MLVMVSEMGMFASLQLEIGGRTILTVLDRGFFQNEISYSSLLHSHSNHELFLISRGECDLMTEVGKVHVSGQSLLFVPAGMPHCLVIKHEDLSHCKSFRFAILSEGRTCTDTGCNPNIPTFHGPPFDKAQVFSNCGALCTSVHQIRSEFLEEKALYLEKVELLFKAFYIDFFRLMAGIPDSCLAKTNQDIGYGSLAGWGVAYGGAYKDLIWDFIQCYTDTFLKRNLSIAQIADILCVSQSQLKRLVKEACGNTLGNFFIEKRIAAAQEIIKRTPDIPVHKVAESVGYETYTGFYQAFLQVAGLTPTEYKNRLRKEEEKHVQSAEKGSGDYRSHRRAGDKHVQGSGGTGL